MRPLHIPLVWHTTLCPHPFLDRKLVLAEYKRAYEKRDNILSKLLTGIRKEPIFATACSSTSRSFQIPDAMSSITQWMNKSDKTNPLLIKAHLSNQTAIFHLTNLEAISISPPPPPVFSIDTAKFQTEKILWSGAITKAANNNWWLFLLLALAAIVITIVALCILL